MEFIVYNPDTVPASSGRPRSNKPVITIHKGGFVLNQPATKAMKIKPDSKIEVLESKDDSQEWAVRVGKVGFSINKGTIEKGYGTFSNSFLATKILTAFQVPETWRVRFELREDKGMFHFVGKTVIQPKSSK
jgi:hypothetical protein